MTDNTPIYMLGGNILPFGQGGMTTTQARNSPLTLVVALANATAASATADRCSGKCAVPQASSYSPLTSCPTLLLSECGSMGPLCGANG